MGALLEHFAAAGVTLTALPDGRLHGAGPLTDALRAAIRAHKPAILAELAANDGATPEQATELRVLLARIAATWSDEDKAEALDVALADPELALVSFRALVAEMAPAAIPDGPYSSAPLAERDPGDDRRTCHDCTHLAGTGRCLSAWHGHPPAGSGRSYTPIDDLLRRCERYLPKADDPDQRVGADRRPECSDATKDIESPY